MPLLKASTILKEVVIERGIFNTMLSSCIEVFPYEAFGLLFGKLKRKNQHGTIVLEYIVNSCIPSQEARKKYSEVELNEKAIELIKQVSEQNRLDFLGDYHSHSQYNKEYIACAELSKDDKKFFEKHKDLISIVLAINQIEKKVKQNDFELANEKCKKLTTFYSLVKKKKYCYKVEFCAYGYNQARDEIGRILIRIVD